MDNTKETDFDKLPKPKGEKVVDGYVVFRWPEFIALMQRLGFDFDRWTTAVEIRVACDEMVRIKHEHAGCDLDKVKAIETTNLHNKLFRTYGPPAAKPEEESWRNKEPLF